MGDQGILQVVKSSSLVYPDEAKSKQTEIGSQEAFQKLLKESHEDPVGFWDSVAQELEWYEPWTETLEGDLPDFKWFVNG
ncbi:MAG: acetyl-coenzyme A synthetase, partial [Bacilli bacterium]|nr:acetyl-coenzyme A synthetase [Bacilli bacterium]